jgi:hypothetical protein
LSNRAIHLTSVYFFDEMLRTYVISNSFVTHAYIA